MSICKIIFGALVVSQVGVLGDSSGESDTVDITNANPNLDGQCEWPKSEDNGKNPCEGKKIKRNNVECSDVGIEQAGGNVSEEYEGEFETEEVPIIQPFIKTRMCPVNVHWHLGAEHLSDGQYDGEGTGPLTIHERRLGHGKVRLGHQCHHYDEEVEMFTQPYDWKHCKDMEVGQTYEVQWYWSAGGACGTPWQYQTPFYDGVFCNIPETDFVALTRQDLASHIGAQAQIFTIVNDDTYYYPDLIKGMIDHKEMGQDITKYTGSTTGTSRNNDICSAYGPITWHVDRNCHKISASSFDKMCADMKAQFDDMTEDLRPHGSRPTTANSITADNQQFNRRLLSEAMTPKNGDVLNTIHV